MAQQVTVAIVGSGFSGIAVAIELKKVGIDDFVILERAATLGGTWRDNLYPGCACDVPSHLYSFSYAPSHEWTRVFAPQPEIRAYLERVADDFDVRRHIRFGQEATHARWDEGRARWHLRLRSGEELEARAVVMAIGALSRPAIPRLRGIERFRGAQFHSARWDHGYDLRGKRVAVIGTGASAIQFVPRIQPSVARLHLFQRTAPWVLPIANRAYRSWERAALRVIPGLRELYRQAIYWRLEGAALAFVHFPALMKVLEHTARRHIARSIRDPALCELLTPKFRAGCKRLLLSNDYYPALAQPNVEVLGDPIAEVSDGAIELESGRRVEVDAIIYGTGFDVHDYLGEIEVIGPGGANLGARWKANGAQAYHGTMAAGFPNYFVMTGPNTGLGHTSMLIMIEAQARYVREAVSLLRDGRAASIAPRPEAEAEYNAWLAERTTKAVWSSGCKSWYLDERGRNTTLWPGFATSFALRVGRLRPEDHEIAPPREREPAIREPAAMAG